MRTYLDCIPCFVRQALEAVRLATPVESVHEQVLRAALAQAAEMDPRTTPPEMGAGIHRMIRRLTGRADPYAEAKARSNALALKLYPELAEEVRLSEDPLEAAVRFAIAGNVMDFGPRCQLQEAEVREAIEAAKDGPLDGDMEGFRQAVAEAEQILYLADNAGEIVFDRLLIDLLGKERTVAAVKGRPVINDATRPDAEAAGLTDLVEVIDNGSDVPGTILTECSEAFRERFERADLVIAKGQGNYETLSEISRDMFFLLKAKCPVIARDLGCQVGSMVLRRSKAAAVAAAGDENLARI